MVTGVIIALILTLVVIPCVAALPTINIDSAAAIGSTFYDYLRAAMYFLPIGTVIGILSIVLALWIFRIIVSVIRTIWAMLPFV